MNNVTDKPTTAARSRRRLSLTWIDFLVISATILTFATVFSAAVGRS